jgi:hypothetical protein
MIRLDCSIALVRVAKAGRLSRLVSYVLAAIASTNW